MKQQRVQYMPPEEDNDTYQEQKDDAKFDRVARVNRIKKLRVNRGNGIRGV